MTNVSGFIVNVANVLASDRYYLLRVVAQQIKDKGYANVSKFFKNLPQSDLDILIDKIAQSKNDTIGDIPKTRRTADLILLATLLALSEGQATFSVEDTTALLSRLVLLSCVSAMDREGKIKALYDNFSMTEGLDKVLYEGDLTT